MIYMSGRRRVILDTYKCVTPSMNNGERNNSLCFVALYSSESFSTRCCVERYSKSERRTGRLIPDLWARVATLTVASLFSTKVWKILCSWATRAVTSGSGCTYPDNSQSVQLMPEVHRGWQIVKMDDAPSMQGAGTFQTGRPKPSRLCD